MCFRILDINIRVVCKYTRLAVTVSADMEILLSSCNTTSNIFTIIKEINHNKGLNLLESPFTNLIIHMLSLLCCCHKLGSCSTTHRNKGKQPCKNFTALFQENRRNGLLKIMVKNISFPKSIAMVYIGMLK
jgi:hypothetical protein